MGVLEALRQLGYDVDEYELPDEDDTVVRVAGFGVAISLRRSETKLLASLVDTHGARVQAQLAELPAIEKEIT